MLSMNITRVTMVSTLSHLLTYLCVLDQSRMLILWNVDGFTEICDKPLFILWLQQGNVSNQREHIVHLLANEQSRLGKLSGNEPVCVFIVSVSHEFSSLIIFV